MALPAQPQVATRCGRDAEGTSFNPESPGALIGPHSLFSCQLSFPQSSNARPSLRRRQLYSSHSSCQSWKPPQCIYFSP